MHQVDSKVLHSDPYLYLISFSGGLTPLLEIECLCLCRSTQNIWFNGMQCSLWQESGPATGLFIEDKACMHAGAGGWVVRVEVGNREQKIKRRERQTRRWKPEIRESFYYVPTASRNSVVLRLSGYLPRVPCSEHPSTTSPTSSFVGVLNLPPLLTLKQMCVLLSSGDTS